MMSPSSFESENGPFVKPVRVSSSGGIKPQLQRASSDQDMIKPVSATEHGRSHAAMAWSTQQVIPSHLLHDKVRTKEKKKKTPYSAIVIG